MIKNIIFDMGNVLLTYDPDIIMNRHVADKENKELIREALFHSPEWNLLDKGVVTDEQVTEAACRRLPRHLHPAVRAIMDTWHDAMPPLEESCDLVRELKEKGYRIYLLSNASLRFHEYEDRLPAFAYFDGKLISADVLMVKPDREIYDKLFSTFDLQPEECFFIDDLPQNVAAGRDAGMTCHQYDGNMEKLRAALCDSGVPVSTDAVLEFIPVTTDEDIRALSELALEIWNQHFVPIIGQAQVDYMVDRFQSYPAMSNQIQNDGYQYYFLRYNGRNVGYTGIKIEDGAMFLSKLYLKKSYRGRKIAKKAMEFLCDLCKEKKLSKIWLTVNRYNEATIGVYLKTGFVKVREQVSDIGNGFVMDDYVMEKTVDIM